MSIVVDPLSFLHGAILIPPVLDQQCDTVIIEEMEANLEKLLKLLFKKVCAKKQQDWLEMFLTIFILVNNAEYVYRAQKQFFLELNQVVSFFH